MGNTQKEQQIRYYAKSHNYMGKVDTAYAKNMFRRVVDTLQLQKSANILEIGCGAGRFTYTFLREGYHITGLDISENLLNKLKDKLTPAMALTIFHGTAEEAAGKKAGKFDYVIGFHVLHHIQQLDSLMSAVHRLLKPDGRMLFIEPNPYGPLFYVQVAIEKDITWTGEKGILNITPRKLIGIISRAGFTHPKVRRFGMVPPALQGLPLAWHVDNIAARIPLLNYPLIFQAITAQKPNTEATSRTAASTLNFPHKCAGKNPQVARRKRENLKA